MLGLSHSRSTAICMPLGHQVLLPPPELTNTCLGLGVSTLPATMTSPGSPSPVPSPSCRRRSSRASAGRSPGVSAGVLRSAAVGVLDLHPVRAAHLCHLIPQACKCLNVSPNPQAPWHRSSRASAQRSTWRPCRPAMRRCCRSAGPLTRLRGRPSPKSSHACASSSATSAPRTCLLTPRQLLATLASGTMSTRRTAQAQQRGMRAGRRSRVRVRVMPG